jgi:hypothetical protein
MNSTTKHASNYMNPNFIYVGAMLLKRMPLKMKYCLAFPGDNKSML